LSVDGLMLCIGSMSPDFAYVLAGSSIAVEGHSLRGVLLFCLPISWVVSWLVARVLAPVVPDHLADGGSFHVRDYRGLATHQFGMVRSSVSALVGAATHVLLDQFTHGSGVFGRQVAKVLPMRRVDPFGYPVTTFTTLQFGVSFVFSVWSLYLLRAYGRQRWLADRARTVRSLRVTRSTRRTLFGTMICIALVLLAIFPDSYVVTTTTIIRSVAAIFVGLCVGAFLTTRRFNKR
jgi:Domain of unknown function (DUF4184)